MRRSIIPIAWSIVLAALAAGCGEEPSEPPSSPGKSSRVAPAEALKIYPGKLYNVEERRLGALHHPMLRQTFSKDGCHLAHATIRGTKQLVVVDGQPGPEYDAIGDLVLSPEGNRAAYSALEGDGASDGHHVIAGHFHLLLSLSRGTS